MFFLQQDSDITFGALFSRIQCGAFSTISPSDYLTRCKLDKVYVGTSRDNNDFSLVEINHSVVNVCLMFGSFVKFSVLLNSEDNSSLELQTSSTKKRRMDDDGESSCTKRCVPPLLTRQKNQKDLLYNDLLTFLSEKNLGWDNPEVYGKLFVLDLSSLLWYIDGHHRVFASRSCEIPPYFSTFVGYNRPERSKHRKRSLSNMTKDKLEEHASTLHDRAMSSWMQQSD